MKKTTLLLPTLFLLNLTASATVFYLDASKPNNDGDGKSWANAKQSLAGVVTLAINNPGQDSIYIKAGTYNIATATSTGDFDNYYGGFQGTESSPADRLRSDLDANGVVEPWEFTNPTIFSTTFDSQSTTAINAFEFGTASTVNPIRINGITFTHVVTSNASAQRTIRISSTYVTFENNIIKNCSLFTLNNTTSGNGGTLCTSFGTISNCLIEKNLVYGTSTADKLLIPGLSFGNGGRFINSVVRNNQFTIDFSTSSATTAVNVAGLAVNSNGGGASKIKFANCLIYNNDGTFIKPAGSTAVAESSSIVTCMAVSNGMNEVYNCVIANNRATGLVTGGLLVKRYSSQSQTIQNNVLWNNMNDNLVKNMHVVLSGGTVSVKNNMMNQGSLFTENSTDVMGNIFDLSDANTGAKTPMFKTPTSVIGTSTGGTIEKANWSILQGSYFIGKGIAASNSTDFVGTAFTTPPSVGAYEYVAPSGFLNTKTVSNIVLVSNKAIVSKINGLFTIYSTTGKVINNRHLSEGEKIQLNSGIYFIHTKANGVSSVQKVVI